MHGLVGGALKDETVPAAVLEDADLFVVHAPWLERDLDVEDAVRVPHQLVDYTHSRETTFFEGGDQQVVHVDFTHPYTPELRAKCLAAGAAAGILLTDGGVYGAVQGPRLETAAEVDRLERDGVTLVGMTGMPEAALARELDLPYAAICVVVNHAAGRGDSAAAISMEGIARVLQTGMGNVRRLLDHVAPRI